MTDVIPLYLIHRLSLNFLSDRQSLLHDHNHIYAQWQSSIAGLDLSTFEQTKKVMSAKYLNTLNDALAYQLSSMFDAEQKLQQEIQRYSAYANYLPLQKELEKYLEYSANKITKLERIFNYLMTDPAGNENLVISKMLEDTIAVLRHSASPRLRDVMLTSFLQAISHYKLGVYKSAQVIALELEVETVSDLLTEILNWERETTKSLGRIALDEIVYHNGYSLY